MKEITTKIFSLLVIVSLMVACGLDESMENDIIGEIEEKSIINQDPILRDFLKNHSIENVKIDRWEDGYILDNCLYVSDDELLERSKIESPRHFGNERINQAYTSFGLINTPGTSKRNITFRFATNFPSSGSGGEWKTAALAAFQHFSNIRNIKLSFQETLNSNQDIILETFSGGGPIAAANLPLNGAPGNRIRVNTSYNNSYNLNQKTAVMVHEIGHIIGLHHTDWQTPSANPNNVPGILINGTWNEDSYSIMNHIYNGQPFNWFAWLDLLAIRNIYPLDLNEKPAYSYVHSTTLKWNWFSTWQGYGFSNFQYHGVNGYVYLDQRPNTVPIYKFYSPGSDWYYTTLNPNDVNFSWTSQGILGYGFSQPGPGRIPIYEYYSPSMGFFFSTQNPSQYAINYGFTLSRIAYYVLSLE
ncbi:zinc-dependent metalloprotease [Belliella sp. DSM 111904]|uniref:Zinc-dependent metalloprotease n=1 Tax=Belliella filtrata TaxID=2923435 RepID=A0ABS9V3V7_9BACT|nr:M57 family metalloprotease [Belliella filtrata]MCH7411081.1 zinc-dependent metalloprotease [Belliella filtrata]